MKSKCKSCELAIFCFTDPANWIFRTREDIKKILRDIQACPTYRELLLEKAIDPLPPLETICK
ncbi:MAG TPA: hypothetical protein ENI41_07990 [Deltaproteobacteria bacterium]|nr:hypothetical protein [Deltaproteobacteria bacterium]